MDPWRILQHRPGRSNGLMAEGARVSAGGQRVVGDGVGVRSPREGRSRGYWPGQKPHSASCPQLVQLTGTAMVPWLPHDGQSKVCCASNPNEA